MEEIEPIGCYDIWNIIGDYVYVAWRDDKCRLRNKLVVCIL